MKLKEMIKLFERDDVMDEEFLKFHRVTDRLSNRPDLHAFLLLDRLVPGETRDIIDGAEHDEFFLSVTPEQLAAVATPERVLELIRCGVRYDRDVDGLAMFA